MSQKSSLQPYLGPFVPYITYYYMLDTVKWYKGTFNEKLGTGSFKGKCDCIIFPLDCLSKYQWSFICLLPEKYTQSHLYNRLWQWLRLDGCYNYMIFLLVYHAWINQASLLSLKLQSWENRTSDALTWCIRMHLLEMELRQRKLS